MASKPVGAHKIVHKRCSDTRIFLEIDAESARVEPPGTRGPRVGVRARVRIGVMVRVCVVFELRPKAKPPISFEATAVVRSPSLAVGSRGRVKATKERNACRF